MLKNLPFKTHLNIHYAACFIGAVIMMAGCYISQPLSLHPVVYVGMVILTARLVWRILFVKCPRCSNGLYNCRNLPKHCPDCSEKLI